MENKSIQEILFKYRWYILGLSIGVILLLTGVVSFTKQLPFFQGDKIEILSAEDETKEVVAEIGGSVQKPGVYKLPPASRIDDALIVAGGLSANADRDWVAKTLNRAAKLTDGQKIYIPDKNQNLNIKSQNDNSKIKSSEASSGLININSASLSKLDKLPGIGPVTAQKIIDNRPYSAVEELITRKILKQKVYEENKEKLSVY